MSTYFNIKNDPILNPPGNVSLGSASNPYQNIYTTGNLVVGNSSFSSDSLNVPKISAISYIGNDTAADTAGGQTVTLTGTGFVAGAQVIINQSYASVVTVVNSTTMTFVTPAQSTGSYILYLVNPDGGTAIAVPGIQYSGVPAWSTSAGSLGSVTELAAINNTVTATGDAPITYSLFSGTLPPGATLNANGTITGTSVVTNSPTTYSFTVRSTDAQNQDTDRTFSITVNPDQVSWASPADGTNYNLTADQSISPVTLSATAASGRSVSYSANTLPTGVSLSGDTISGTPTTTSNVSTLLTATSSTTNRSATRTITWTVSVGSDTSWSYVTTVLSATALTLPFNNDASTNNFAVTVFGDTRPNNFGPYTPGYYSNYFDGSSSISIPAGAAFNLSTVDFSIEMWVYPIAQSTYGALLTFDAGDYPLVFGWAGIAGSNIGFGAGTASAWIVQLEFGTTVLNRWTHLVATRSGNNWRTFQDGVLRGYSSASGTVGDSSGSIFVGSNGSSGWPSTAYISNLRIIKGSIPTDYQTSNTTVGTTIFTPPTTPLTTTSQGAVEANVSLLTCQSNRFIDNSTNNFTVTRNSNPTVNGFDPFVPSSNTATFGSGYFDGTGDYLTVPNNINLTIGSGDFTIECWVYYTGPANGATYGYQIAGPATGQGSSGWAMVVNRNIDTRGFGLVNANGWVTFGTTFIVPNVWTHLAVTRSGLGTNNVKCFINGVVSSQASYNTADSYTATPVYIGADGLAGSQYPGYISNFRFVSGTALYTSAFTPPTTPLTAVSGTSLLTLQTNQPANNNAFLDSSTNNFLVTRNGNTTQGSFSPYGPLWSNYFDGNGDYLSATTTALTGTWTIEFWVYQTATGDATNGAGYVYNGTTSSNTNRVQLFRNPNGSLGFYVEGSGTNFAVTSSADAVPLNTWCHIAVVSNGSTITSYVNGSQVASGSITVTPSPGTAFYIGVYRSSATLWSLPGYISNFRYTRSVVYASAFTPSTSPLTVIANTSLLTCTDNRLIDDSPNNFAITRNGDVSVQKFSPFSPQTLNTFYSGYFDGTATSTAPLVISTASGQLNLPGDFTIELWFYDMGTSKVLQQFAFQSSGGFGCGINAFDGNATRKLDFRQNGGSLVYGVTAITPNVWNHAAFVRSGTAFRIFLNGVLDYYNANYTTSFTSSSTNIGSAANGDTVYSFLGYISNFRIVKGTAVYTTSSTTIGAQIFTPPTTPLTAIANTSLLTCQNATFIDNSTNNFTITVAGNTRPTTVSPFTPTATTGVTYSPSTYGGSVYFDGSGDFLTVPYNLAINLSSGNWTIECWVYWTGTNVNAIFLNKDGVSGSSYPSYSLNLTNGTPQVILASGNGTSSIQTPTSALGVMPKNTWVHLAAVLSGSTIYLFQNGQLAVSTAVTATIIDGGKALLIGYQTGQPNSQYMDGYISNARIIKGTALYTSNFAPPVSPLTAIQNNVLLLNGTGAGVYDMSMMNDYQSAGNSSLVTSIEKYGNSSLFFDGSGDYLQTPPGIVTSLGSANFTIEFWLYLPTLPGARAQLLYWNANSSGYAAVALQVCSSNKLGLSFSESGSSWKTDDTTGVGSVLTAATWQHVALVRNGQNIQIYLNGVAQGSAYTTTASTTSLMTTYTLNQIGTYNTGFHSLNGYIDDLRITNGVARYTANFTPTSSPFFVN